MPSAPHLSDEQQRNWSLYDLSILGTPSEALYDKVARTAKNVFDLPTVFISLVDIRWQWFKSKIGFEVCEISRDVSFCAYAICQEITGDVKSGVFEVHDAKTHPMFSDNVLLINELSIRDY